MGYSELCWHANAPNLRLIPNIWTRKPTLYLGQACFWSLDGFELFIKYPTSLCWEVKSSFWVSLFKDPHLLYFSITPTELNFHLLHLEHLFPHPRPSGSPGPSLLHIDKGSRNISYLPQMITVLLQRIHSADKNAEGLLKGTRCLSCKIQLHLCNSSANRSESFGITTSDSGVCDSDPHPSPPSPCKVKPKPLSATKWRDFSFFRD